MRKLYWILVLLLGLLGILALLSSCVGTDTETSIVGLLAGNGTYVTGLAFSGNTTTYLDGSGNWTAPAGGGGVPGGANTQVQFNDVGAFGGDAGLTYVKATDQLTVAGDFFPQQDTYVGNDLHVTNDLTVTSDVTIGGLLSSAASIVLKPSGDTDDYFTFSTVADVPTITATGATPLRIGNAQLDLNNNTSLVLYDNGFSIRNTANTLYRELIASKLKTYGTGVYLLRSGYEYIAPDIATNDSYYWFGARDNGVGGKGVGGVFSGADPYIQIGRNDNGVGTASVTDMLVLQAGAGTNNEAAGFGLGVPFKLGNAASEVEERARINAVLVTATNGSEDSRLDFYTQTGGANGIGMTLDRGTLVPPSDASGSVGTAALRWNLVRAVTITPGDLAWEEWQDPFTSEPFGKGDALVLLVTGIETQEVDTVVGHDYQTVTKTRPMTRDVFDKDGITVIGSENFTETYTETIDIPITKTETIHLTRTVPVRLSTVLKYAWAEMQKGNFSRLDGRLDAPNLLTRQSK